MSWLGLDHFKRAHLCDARHTERARGTVVRAPMVPDGGMLVHRDGAKQADFYYAPFWKLA